VDYRKFLATKQAKETLVLPYFGGTRVDAADRRLRVDATARIEPGWHTFEIDGRRAKAVGPGAPTGLDALPAVRGHWAGGWIFVSGRELGRIALPPDEEPLPLARITARRWHSGDLLLDSIDFEDDAEVSARAALEEGRSIAELRAVVPSLRAAFALSLALAVARQAGVPISHREIAPHVVAIGDGGPAAVRALLERLVAERRAAEAAALARLEQARLAQRGARLQAAAASAVVRRRSGDPVARADAALEAAGARMLSARRLSGARLEVRVIVDDVRLITVVAAETLQVLDAGLCLAGADRMITLDSLPSVVREAVRMDHLNLTRHDR